MLALSLRFIFLSHWLTDWDSVQFAMALKDFDILKHQPHPPGYILYIFLGRVFNVLLKNDTLALTSLSALLGTLTAIPLYLLAKEITNKKIAFISTVLFLVAPIHWLLSEVALTNVPGMFFTVLTAYLLYKAKDSKNFLLLGSFLAGLTLGVRFAEYSIVLSLLILVLIYRKNIKDILKASIYFSAGILIWLIPLIFDTGWLEFVHAYSQQISYIASHDSTGALISRLVQIWKLFLTGYSPFFIPIAIFALSRFRKNLFLAVWLLSYLIPLIFIYNLEVSRHVLPLLPPFVLMFSLILSKFKNKILLVCCIILTMAIFLTSFSQVKKQNMLTPPSIAPVLYVKENFNPQNTTLITTFTFRQFQYYAPEFENYWGSENAPGDIESEIIVTDFSKLKDQIPTLTNYNVVDEKTFIGSVEIFPRLPRTNLYILKNKQQNPNN